MTDTAAEAQTGETAQVIAMVGSGDTNEFADLAERHRQELRVHCYRMLGNLDDADDAVQNTLTRAWARRGGFEGRSTFRAWLYRIATNACLDTIKQRRRRVPTVDRSDLRPAYDELPWLQPMPTAGGPAAPMSTTSDPEAAILGRETIELVILASIQYLTPRQRAVLILRDLLGWTPSEIAELLADSTSSVNSLLQRARRRMTALGQDLSRPGPTPPTSEQRTRLEQYIDAHARADAAAIVDLLAADVRLTMPPYEARYDGLTAAAPFFEHLLGATGPGTWHLIATEANGQLAAVNYLQRGGESDLRATTIDVVYFQRELISEIITFGADAIAAFGLPATLPQASPAEGRTR